MMFWQKFLFTLLFRQNVRKHQYLLWQRRLALTIVAVMCSLLIDLLIPNQASTQQAAVPLTPELMHQQRIFSVQPRFQGNIIRQIKLSPKNKAIALTFDDGPSPNTTPQVLEILKQNKIKATFFLIGKNLKSSPQIGQQIVADGHALGNHTWHHWRKLMMEFTAAREINDTARLLYDTTGVLTSLFRPPNGFLNNGLANYAVKQKDVVVLWSVDSQDWRGSRISVEDLVNNVVNKVTSGGIVLMHDGGGDRSRTVQALPTIINKLTQQGYKFVTVPELLEMQDSELKAPSNA